MKLLVIHNGNDLEYMRISFEIAHKYKHKGNEVWLLDLSDINKPFGNNYSENIAKLFAISNFQELYIDCCKELELDYLNIDHFKGNQFENYDDTFHLAQEDSINSALITYLGNPKPNLDNFFVKRLSKKLLKAAFKTSQVLKDVITNTGADTVYIPNGRFPYQKAILDIANEFNLRKKFYEKGSTPSTYLELDQGILDRHLRREAVDEILKGFSRDKVSDIAEKWLKSRDPRFGAATNVYAQSFKTTKNARNQQESKIATIFTSSQDEYASLGAEWHNHGWTGQYEALNEVTQRLVQLGYIVRMRVHPNLNTKSSGAYSSEIHAINKYKKNFPGISVFDASSTVNSYELIEQSKLVIVWDSTIGLEALLMGKAAWQLAPSYYDSYAQIGRWHFPKFKPRVEDLEFQPDTESAQRFVAYMVLRDKNITLNQPKAMGEFRRKYKLRLRISEIAGSGGKPSIALVLMSILLPIYRRGIFNYINKICKVFSWT